MFNSTRLFFVLFFSIFFAANIIFAQDIGKIVSKSDADNLFGDVIANFTVPSSSLENLLEETDSVIMFQLKNGILTILGDDRNFIYSSGNYVENDEIFKSFSKSKLTELLNNGGGATTTIENRVKVMSITNGNFTLEWGAPCPPYCG